MLTKTTLRQAVNDNCRSCIYDSDEPGTWLSQVENCKISRCAIFEHRPVTSKTRALNNEIYLASLSQPERAIIEERSKKRALNLSNGGVSKQVCDRLH